MAKKQQTPTSVMVSQAIGKLDAYLDQYESPVCSVSGGSDSDIVMDLIERVRRGRPMQYVFFDTKMEYQATKRHLEYLENKYNTAIARRDAPVPVPDGCREYGLPFLEKNVSENIDRLQRHGFQWEDEPLQVLLERYDSLPPKKNCRAALKWWCNDHGEGSRFNIEVFPWLKEFMVAQPPRHKISQRCCEGAKKILVHQSIKEFHGDLNINGMRRAEGGQRAFRYDSCFQEGAVDGVDTYMPLYLWSDMHKREYKRLVDVSFSDCYEVYGLKRTGCAGCPFGSRFEEELEAMKKWEPGRYAAALNTFGLSYEYMREYRQFKEANNG